ncbi:MAG TPA: hypothetical protein PKE00_10685 [Planctomycetota bacterium]|nr:hypothetical protein [Planctomycetota bacterium]
MILKSFLVLLLLFLATQVVAWRNMVRGRFALGFVQFAGIFALADVLLILHFVVGRVDADDGRRFGFVLAAFWILALLSIFEYLFHAVRARKKSFRERQARIYGEALDHFMQGKDALALRGFRRCSRGDPWDAPAMLMVGTLLARSGERAAGRWLRRALARAEDQRLKEEIEEELRCLTRPRQKQESQESQESPESPASVAEPPLLEPRQKPQKQSAG